MEQAAILQQQLPLHDYTLTSDHDYNDHYAHHQSFATNQVSNQLRRDSAAPLQGPAPFAFQPATNTHGARFLPDRAATSDANIYQVSSNFADSSSGSISTSPSSAASSLAFTNFSPNHCTAVPSFSGPVQLPQSFVHHPCAGIRVPSVLDGAGSGMLPPPNPIHSSFSRSVNAHDREAYAGLTPYLARTQPSPGSQSMCASYSDTSRGALNLTSLTLSNPLPYASSNHSHMASSSGYSVNPHNECGEFPWPTLEIHAEMSCDGQAVTPEVVAKVEKGFFRSTVDQKWTCYRRNYFSVQCNFELHPNVNNGRMFLKRSNSANNELIQAMGMRLSAAIEGTGSKSIELIQHTPKRDNGPKNKIDIVKVSPTPPGNRREHGVSSHGIYQTSLSNFAPTVQVPGPYLPMQLAHESAASPNSSSPSVPASRLSNAFNYSAPAASHVALPGQNTTHTFERVQFKQATANNGKRRASQQYFHLLVELFAHVRKQDGGSMQWVKVAHRVSEKIVVRGRSPSHYQNEGQHQSGRAGSSGGSSAYSHVTNVSSYGAVGSSAFRTSSMGYGAGPSGSTYRSNSASFESDIHPSPEHSESSASSVDGEVNYADFSADAVMHDTERNDAETSESYHYFSGSTCENNVVPEMSMPKTEHSSSYSTDVAPMGVKCEVPDALTRAGQWPVDGLGNVGSESRFQSTGSSHSSYTDTAVSFS